MPTAIHRIKPSLPPTIIQAPIHKMPDSSPRRNLIHPNPPINLPHLPDRETISIDEARIDPLEGLQEIIFVEAVALDEGDGG